MKIISNELRLKDIEWTEKMVENSRKIVKSAGSVSLEDKKKKEELAAMEKVLHLLSEEDKDVRKGDWTSKEVSFKRFMSMEEGTMREGGKSSDDKESRDSRFYNPARRWPIKPLHEKESNALISMEWTLNRTFHDEEERAKR